MKPRLVAKVYQVSAWLLKTPFIVIILFRLENWIWLVIWISEVTSRMSRVWLWDMLWSSDMCLFKVLLGFNKFMTYDIIMLGFGVWGLGFGV